MTPVDLIRAVDPHVRLRLLRGRQGPEGPARRQGRQPGGDGEARASGPARVHDLHRGVPGVPGGGPPPGGAGRRGGRPPGDAGGRPGTQARRPRRPAAGVRPVRGEVLDARDDGDGPEHRVERRERARVGGPVGQPAVRVGLLPAADPDVRQDRPAHRRGAVRGRPRRAQGAQGRHRRPRSRRGRPGGAGRGLSRRSSASTPAATSRRTRASSSPRRSTRCSRRGTPSGRCSTGARSGSRTSWARR